MKKKFILIPILATSLLSGCVLYNGRDPTPSSSSAITDITTDKTSLEFNKGDLSKQVTATLVGDGEFDEGLTVVSENTEIATVKGKNDKFTSGVAFDVIPASHGDTRLVITSIENTKIKTYVDIKVNDVAATIPVSEVTLNKSSLDLIIGNNETLTATVVPSDATNKNISWSSSDSNVATVDNNGKVVAVSAGTARITVTTVDGQKTATCEVTVKKDQTITSGYYLVGTMTNWSKNVDYKMIENPSNHDEMMITWQGKMNDEVKVVFKPESGDDDWKQINAAESGSTGNCAVIEGENFKLKANAKFTLYFLKTAIGGTYKYWFTSSLN